MKTEKYEFEVWTLAYEPECNDGVMRSDHAERARAAAGEAVKAYRETRAAWVSRSERLPDAAGVSAGRMTATPVDLDELEALAKECMASIGPAGSSTVPFMRALRAYQEAALPEVTLALIAELRAARDAPPADEVAGLLSDLDMVRGELRDYALEHPSYRALDRIENHLKGKR